MADRSMVSWGDIEVIVPSGFHLRQRGPPRPIGAALARETGLTREGLYEALSADGNPEFATVMKVIRALGLHLHGSAARS